MAEKVQADYEQLGQVSSQFSNQSQVVQELVQKLRGSMEQLEDGGWIGKGSNAFFSEMHSVLFPTLQKLDHALDIAASTTNQIAQKMQQAEEESQSLFVL